MTTWLRIFKDAKQVVELKQEFEFEVPIQIQFTPFDVEMRGDTQFLAYLSKMYVRMPSLGAWVSPVFRLKAVYFRIIVVFGELKKGQVFFARHWRSRKIVQNNSRACDTKRACS